jgi:hypothetical protein
LFGVLHLLICGCTLCVLSFIVKLLHPPIIIFWTKYRVDNILS